MRDQIILIGDIFIDHLLDTSLFDDLINHFSTQILNFTRYNPDDLNRRLLSKMMRKALYNMPRDINSDINRRLGGDLINIAQSIAKLKIPNSLVSSISLKDSWILDKLDEMNIKTSYISLTKPQTLNRYIIKTNDIVKTINDSKSNNNSVQNLNNLKSITEEIADKSKIIFLPNYSKEIIQILNFEKNSDPILVIKLDYSTIQDLDLKNVSLIDIAFITIKTSHSKTQIKEKINEFESKVQDLIKLRIYFDREGMLYLFNNFTSKLRYNLPNKIKIKFPFGEDKFISGFLYKLYHLLDKRSQINRILKNKSLKELDRILKKCGKIAYYYFIYWKENNENPTENELLEFTK